MKRTLGSIVAVLMLTVTLQSAIVAGADRAPVAALPPASVSHEPAIHHEDVTVYLGSLVMHAREVGLSGDQLVKIKVLQLDSDLIRIKAQADIMLMDREIALLAADEKVDIESIGTKIARSQSSEADLRLAQIRILRKALALLTPEQRDLSKRVLGWESSKEEHRS